MKAMSWTRGGNGVPTGEFEVVEVEAGPVVSRETSPAPERFGPENFGSDARQAELATIGTAVLWMDHMRLLDVEKQLHALVQRHYPCPGCVPMTELAEILGVELPVVEADSDGAA